MTRLKCSEEHRNGLELIPLLCRELLMKPGSHEVGRGVDDYPSVSQRLRGLKENKTKEKNKKREGP